MSVAAIVLAAGPIHHRRSVTNPAGPSLTDLHRQLAEAFAQDQDRAVLAEDVVLRDQAQERTFHGKAAVGRFLDALFRGAFAGARTEVGTMLLGGETAAFAFTFYGRHEGVFMGLPPTRRAGEVPMVMVLQMGGGEIRQADLYYNAGTLLRQIGL